MCLPVELLRYLRQGDIKANLGNIARCYQRERGEETGKRSLGKGEKASINGAGIMACFSSHVYELSVSPSTAGGFLLCLYHGIFTRTEEGLAWGALTRSLL